MSKLELVAVDSGPFILGVDFTNFTNHIITVPGVLKEIKDLNTRQRIRNLPPFFISIKEPSNESIKHVISVAKKTGDIKVLSKVDLDIIALSYEMKTNQTDITNLFKRMSINDEYTFTMNQQYKNFFEDDSESILTVTTEADEETCSSKINELIEGSDEGEQSDIEEDSSYDESSIIEESEETDQEEEIEEEEITKESTEKDDIDDDGWITKKNINTKLHSFEGNDCIDIDTMENKPNIACCTTDFAVQNVLKHLDIEILSANGLIIKNIRSFVSRCRSCFHVYKSVNIYFCPHCGNNSLGRIPAALENGELKLFLKKDFKPNLRNTKFSIPKPQSGKHTDGCTYIYCADQRLPQERQKKNKRNTGNEWDFCPRNDVASRSAVLGIRERVLKPSIPRGNKKNGRKRR